MSIDELRRELDRLRLAHRLTCDAYGDLLAAAWASVSAAETGTSDPLWQLRDELLAHPLVSPPGAGDPTAATTFGAGRKPAPKIKRSPAKNKK